jgi:hypothetical protein
VFHQMVERLGEFVIPYQDALEPETGQHHLHLYLQGLLSLLPRGRVPRGCGYSFETSAMPPE